MNYQLCNDSDHAQSFGLFVEQYRPARIMVEDHLRNAGRLNPPGSSLRLYPAFRDRVSGRSSSTRSWATLGVMRPRSPRSSRTRP